MPIGSTAPPELPHQDICHYPECLPIDLSPESAPDFIWWQMKTLFLSVQEENAWCFLTDQKSIHEITAVFTEHKFDYFSFHKEGYFFSPNVL